MSARSCYSDGLHGLFFDKFQRGMQSGDAVRIERARLEPCRIRLRLFAVVGVNTGAAAGAAAEALRPAGCTDRRFPADPSSGPLWPVEAEHVNVHALHVDRYRTCRLRCVDNQKGAVCVRHCTDFGDIGAGFRSDWMHACRQRPWFPVERAFPYSHSGYCP